MDNNEEQNENITQETVNNTDEMQENIIPEDSTNHSDLSENEDEDKSLNEEEIEFDDNIDIDIDAIQNKLQQQLDGLPNTEENENNNDNENKVEVTDKVDENVNEENKNKETNAEEEIEFDDNIDIEALQNKLQQQMQNNGIVYKPAEGKDSDTVNKENELPKKEDKKTLPALKKRLIEKRDNYKKYIIYVSEENVEYIDSLSIDDRKKIINDILHDRDVVAKRTRHFKENAKFANQILIMVFTVVLALPIFFFLLNKSIETTIVNYQQAQQNFVKLYREQGKIKNYKNFGSKY